VTHLKDLDHETSNSQQRSFNRGENKISEVETKCDSTVPEEPKVTDHQSWTLTTAEADNLESQYQSRVNLSSVSGAVVTNGPSFASNTKSLECQLQTDKTNQPELRDEVANMKAEVKSLRTDLRRSDEMVALLKRHIELNTTADGSPLPSFSPDVIVALAQEVERLNAELEKLSTEGRLNDATRELASQSEPPTGHVPSGSGGHSEPVQHEVRSRSSLSMHNLDSALTGGEAMALDHSTRQRSASVDDLHQVRDEPLDKLPVKDALLRCDGEAAGDRTTKSTYPLSAASFVGDQKSFLGSPSARNVLRQSNTFIHSPFQSTNSANQRAFAELQAEVERLRRRLELTELENSRLLERSARESMGSFPVAASGRPSVNSQAVADTSLSLDGSLVKYSASGDVTMAAGFLKKLVNVSIYI